MLNTERICTFTEATKALPKLNGRRPHPSTIWRWARKGVKGVRLESRRIGGRFVTSQEALERFAERLADVAIPDHHPEAPPAPKARSNRQRQRDVGRAESDLKAAGI